MNAYYENRNIGSVAGRHSLNTTYGDKFISLICAIVAFFTSAAAIKIEKAALATVCFVAFFGVIGSIDNGSVGMFGGILLCAAFSFVEFLVFKSMAKKNKTSKQ